MKNKNPQPTLYLKQDYDVMSTPSFSVAVIYATAEDDDSVI